LHQMTNPDFLMCSNFHSAVMSIYLCQYLTTQSQLIYMTNCLTLWEGLLCYLVLGTRLCQYSWGARLLTLLLKKHLQSNSSPVTTL
jgi:hypothetical protein